MMKKLINEKKQEILDDAPEWATVLLEKVCDGMSEYAIEKCGSFWDMQDVSQNNPYGNAFVTAAWNVKCNLSDIRKELELEAEPQPITPKLTYLIDIFKAEFPQGFQSLGGYSKEDFDDEVLSMSSHAGLIKFDHYTATNKALPEPEDKQQKIVDAVNWLKGDLGNLQNGAHGSFKSIILKVNGDYYGTQTGKSAFHRDNNEVFNYACTIDEFNQCVFDLTGDPLKHAAWLAALNDMRGSRAKGGFLSDAVLAASYTMSAEIEKLFVDVSTGYVIGENAPIISEAVPNVKDEEFEYGDPTEDHFKKIRSLRSKLGFHDGDMQSCGVVAAAAYDVICGLEKHETQKAAKEREEKAELLYMIASNNENYAPWESVSDIVKGYFYNLADADFSVTIGK